MQIKFLVSRPMEYRMRSTHEAQLILILDITPPTNQQAWQADNS